MSKTRLRTPAKYRAPLRSRNAITDYLLNRDGHCSGHDWYLFAFNVKAYGVDLDFWHLLDLWIKTGEPTEDDEWALKQPEYFTAIETAFTDAEEKLFWAGQERAWDDLTDSETYQMLWDGTEIDVEYSGFGRSSGWIVITRLLHEEFNSRDREPDYEEWLNSLSMERLRLVYRFIVQCTADFTQKSAAEAIEYGAAFWFFEHYCADIPRPVRPENNIGAFI